MTSVFVAGAIMSAAAHTLSTAPEPGRTQRQSALGHH
jgi:hypothetical protein